MENKRQYSLIIQDLDNLLNHHGRQKKGFNSSENLLSLCVELKNFYGVSISKQFLFNLMKENNNLTDKQKHQKIRHILKGIETQKQNKYNRVFEWVKYRTNIKEYGYKKGFVKYKPKRETIKILINGIETAQEIIKDYGVSLKNIRVQNIGKEFITNKKEVFNFIKV